MQPKGTMRKYLSSMDTLNTEKLDENFSHDGFSNFRFLGIGKISEGQKKRREQVKKTFSDARKNIKQTTKEITHNSNLKAGLKNVFLTYDPIVAIPRSSALLAFRVNLFGISTRLYPAFLSDEELVKYNFDIENAQRVRHAWEKTANFWEDKIGGNRQKLKEAITGSWNKPVFKTKKAKSRKEQTSTFDGNYDRLTERYAYPSGAEEIGTASYLTSGLTIISVISGIISQNRAKKNPFKSGSSEAQIFDNQIAGENPPPLNTNELNNIEKGASKDKAKGLGLDNTGIDSTDIDNSSDDKILGMPKGLAIGLGVAVLLVGGFIIYKKFIAKK